MLSKNKSYELTTTQLKKYEGFENVTEDEAKEIISQFKELSQLLFGIFIDSTTQEAAESVKEGGGVNETEIINPTDLEITPRKCKRNKLTTKNNKP